MKQLKMIEQKKKQRHKETHQAETHTATGHENHPGTYLSKNPSG